MRAPNYGVWVLCRTRYHELIVVHKADHSHWSSYLPEDYEYIAEGEHDAMKLIQKLMKESTCSS